MICQRVQQMVRTIEGIDYHGVVEAAQIIVNTYRLKGVVYTCGNGGSASTAEHLAIDLAKNTKKPIKTICLTSNVSALTAYANDTSYEFALAHQVGNVEANDTAVLISTSGNSPNIVAVRHVIGGKTRCIILTGGKWSNLVSSASPNDIVIQVPSEDIEILEDVHLFICHTITRLCRESE